MGEAAAGNSQVHLLRGFGSSAMARAAVDALDAKVVAPHTGQSMSSAAKADAAEFVQEFIQSILDAKAPRTRDGVGWILSCALGFALVVIAGLEGWSRVNDLEDRLDDGDHYAQTLANYLVVKAGHDHDNATSADQLLRALAASAGLKTDHIPAPVQSHPPPATARRAAAYREGREE